MEPVRAATPCAGCFQNAGSGTGLPLARNGGPPLKISLHVEHLEKASQAGIAEAAAGLGKIED